MNYIGIISDYGTLIFNIWFVLLLANCFWWFALNNEELICKFLEEQRLQIEADERLREGVMRGGYCQACYGKDYHNCSVCEGKGFIVRPV